MHTPRKAIKRKSPILLWIGEVFFADVPLIVDKATIIGYNVNEEGKGDFVKIKIKHKSYDAVMALPRPKHQKPKRPNIFFRTLLKLVSIPDILATHFRLEKVGMEQLGKREPCLFLMNHSSFLDLEIAVTALYPRPLNIVSTKDAFVGKNWLMRNLGCVPTVKLVSDVSLVRDVFYAVKEKKNSILIFPEAGYSLDGTATVLPDNFAQFVKKLGVPVVMIRTYGAFSRDPLYNNLQRRRVAVTAKMEYLFSAEDLEEKSDGEIDAVIRDRFTFDNFRWQRENAVKIDEPFRADMLHRVLYRCPHCSSEGEMHGEGIYLTCKACGVRYVLSEYGELIAEGEKTKFSLVTDWFAWQRSCVREELLAEKYGIKTPVTIALQVDNKALYFVGEGELSHTKEGLHLIGRDGKIDVTHKAHAMYSANVEFNFYEIGDMISFGNAKVIYYCFPKDPNLPVAKVRLAAEELYRLAKEMKAN